MDNVAMLTTASISSYLGSDVNENSYSGTGLNGYVAMDVDKKEPPCLLLTELSDSRERSYTTKQTHFTKGFSTIGRTGAM